MAVRALAVSLAAMVAICARADAEPRVATGPELGLAWDAPTSCPSSASMRARIERRLGRSLDDVVLGISVDVRAHGGRFVARIDLGAVTVANDVRTLTSARCDELADAVAVIVARVAREAAVGRRPAHGNASTARDDVTRDGSDDPPGVQPRVATRSDSADAEVHGDVVAARPRHWAIGARLSAISGIGVVPEVGWGSEIAGYVRRDEAMLEIGEARWLASSQKIRYGTPAQVDVGFQVTAARFGWRPERLPLRAWLAVEVGQMNGSSDTLATSQTGSGRWIAAGSGFGVGWQMAPWIRLVGTTEIDIAFQRVRFTLSDGVVVYQPAPASARATCGLEIGWQ